MTSIQHSTLNIENSLQAKPLVVIVGPTAVGKSRVGVLLAKAMGTEVLTADSRQVYRGMDIGMDKPTLEERQGVPHRLIDLVEPDQPFNAGLYRRHAMQDITRLHASGRVPLIVGGTGLYVRTLLRGLWDGPPADWALRERLEAEACDKGPAFLYQELSRVDPVSARRLHPNDRVKIIRALEVHQLSGLPLSDAIGAHGFGESPFSPLLIGLTRERDALYRRIDARVDEQLAKGLVAETQRLLRQGYDRRLGSMKGLGYRQIAGYVAGDYSYEEAVRLLKRDTRHFAKRQLTWFRKEPGLVWLTIEETDTVEHVTARIAELVTRFLADLAGTAAAASCNTVVAT